VPTLLDHGTEWQKERFIRPTLTGELIWCQGYSEPGSGSDLASLTTRAELVGDEWVINGQKIWTSAAHLAGMMFILCRTEPGASKHAGISYLLVNMKQPGIEVQPLRQMTGDTTFNQVFLSDARTPADHIVGKRGEGWLVSRSTLKHERNSIGSAANVRALFESLVRLAHRQRRNGRSALEDPVIRQRLAEIDGYVTAHECSGYRQLTCDARGASPGLVGMMNKLVSTNVGHLMAKLALDIVDGDGLRAPASRRIVGELPDRSNAWVGQFMNSLGAAIAGGTANIQRNIIAERGLGLPRDWAAQRSRE
jgi:alkylation response protein AidB-like acyl-CoA dehydrogenase